MYSINFTVRDKRFCLSLHYNEANSYLFVNGTEIYKFKAKDSKIVPSPLCLGNISKDWTHDNMKKQGLMVMFMILVLININSNNPIFFPFSIKTSKCSGNCNNINDPYARICISDTVKNVNVKVFNLMSTDETKHIEWHETYK